MSNQFDSIRDVIRDGIARAIAVVGLAGIALIHLLDAPGTFQGSAYKGWLYVAAIVEAGGWKVATSEGAGPAGVASGAVKCVLAPEMTEGPYYLPNEKVRRNITEGHSGTPLLLHLTVVDASTCRPIKGAAVDIWHADALGVYSGESV